MRIITKDAVSHKERSYELLSSRPTRPIIRHDREDSCDADEELRLSKKAVELLNALVEQGVTADDIIANCKPQEDKESGEDEEEAEEDLDEEAEEETEEETEEESDDKGEEVEEKEEVKEFGDSLKPTMLTPKNDLKSIGANIKTATKDSLSNEEEEIKYWENRNKK